MSDDMEFYDRKGKRISFKKHEKLSDDKSYVTIGENQVDGKLIRTLWLGCDPSPYDKDKEELSLFITSVYSDLENFDMIDAENYNTEEEAIKGHSKYVSRYSPQSTHFIKSKE